MSDVEIPEEVMEEKSGVHFIPVKPPIATPVGPERFWKWAALVLTTLLAAGSLLGVFGHSFYVSRTEYTEQVKEDAVAREGMRNTLERLDKTLATQAAAFQALAGQVQDMKINVAVLQKSR